MQEFFFVTFIKYLPFLLKGALVTIQLSILSMGLGLIIGLLTAIGRLSNIRPIAFLLFCYVEICRDVPLIVQLLVLYFTLPEIGIRLPGFVAGVVGLSLNLGAYTSEVFRAAIISIDAGQRDAGISLGMSRATVYRRVILPQALLIAVPTLGGYFIGLLKDCSLVSFIAVNELLRHGTIIIASTYRSMDVYLMVGMIYFVMSFGASHAVRWIEHKLTPPHLVLPR